MRTTVKLEMRSWTVRLDGHFIADFKWWNAEAKAYRLANYIERALMAPR